MSRQNFSKFESPQTQESVSSTSSRFASNSGFLYDLFDATYEQPPTVSTQTEFSPVARDTYAPAQYIDIAAIETSTNKRSPIPTNAPYTPALDRTVSIKDLTEKGIFEKIDPSELRHSKRASYRYIPPMTYVMAAPYTSSSQPNPLLSGQLNYYNFNAADRSIFNTEVPTPDELEPSDSFKKRERLAPGEAPSIRIEYEDAGKTNKDSALPDFRITADGKVQVLNNPEINPFKEIIIEVERAGGYVGLPSDAQQKTLVSLTAYLSERIKQSHDNKNVSQIGLKDQQGLLPEESATAIDAAPQPEDSLPPPTQEQTQALNRFDGSGSGSISPSDANDYFPPSQVAPLPNESPNLSALKDLVAGFSTRGIAEPYTAVQNLGLRGFGVGRYALTAGTIFDWIEGLSDAELAEIDQLEITTADGKKKKIKIPKDTGAKLKTIRDLLKAVKAGNGAQGSDRDGSPQENTDESDKALDLLFNDTQIRDFTRLLVQMQKGEDKPGVEQISKVLGPEMQELIATDLILRFAKEATDSKTSTVNIGQVVLSMYLGKTPSAQEANAPENKALMDAAERGYPLALQHSSNPDEPVSWSEKNGKFLSNPNDYFFSQFRNDTYNPTGPSRSNNCGPASLAMAAKAFDRDADIGDIEKQIDRARVAMTGRNNYSELTSLSQIAGGAKKLGLSTASVADLNSLNSALDSGKQVVLYGNPAGAYGNRLSSGQYAHYNGLHFILVAEKAADAVGKTSYVVNDPLSRKGSITVSSTELSRYMRKDNAGRSGIAVWA